MNKHQSRLLFWSLEILLIVLIIWGCTQIDFIFRPIGTFFSTLFAPVLIAATVLIVAADPGMEPVRAQKIFPRP